MNWEQFKEADDRECMKDAFSNLNEAKASLVEALTSINEALESFKVSNSSLTIEVKFIKLALEREKESLESIIQLDDD